MLGVLKNISFDDFVRIWEILKGVICFLEDDNCFVKTWLFLESIPVGP